MKKECAQVNFYQKMRFFRFFAIFINLLIDIAAIHENERFADLLLILFKISPKNA